MQTYVNGHDLDPFYTSAACACSECQTIHSQYTSVYSKYVDQHEQIRALSKENALLRHDIDFKMAVNELKIKNFQQKYEHEAALVEAFLGKISQEGVLVSGPPTCANCMGHKRALVEQRKRISNDYSKNQKDFMDNERIIEQCRASVALERAENGRLRAMQYKKDDAFWGNREICALKEQCRKMQEDALVSNDAFRRLQGDNETLRQRLISANNIKDMLECDLCRVRSENEMLYRQNEAHGLPVTFPSRNYRESSAGPMFLDPFFRELEMTDLKSQLADVIKENENLKQDLCKADLENDDDIDQIKLAIVDLRQDKNLMNSLKRTFTMAEDVGESDEKALYKLFMDELPPEERENTVKSMFRICNDGKNLSIRELKKFRDNNSQISKKSFAVCLHSIGGRYKMKQSKRVWLNVKKQGR